MNKVVCKYSTIVAVHSQEWVIGLDGQLPWRVKNDMKWFKNITTGGVVIMGRKTWESIGMKPLTDRINIVVSKTIQ